MMRSPCVVSAVVAVCLVGGAVAQQPQQAKLDDTQTLGRNLFLQSCGECHLLPQLGAPRYAPQLSRESLGGNEFVMRDFIANGTQRMPGFRFTFTPTQIAAIVSYLKTIRVQGNAGQNPNASQSNSRDQD
jgi:mono/diheme cytochrome c family protein